MNVGRRNVLIGAASWLELWSPQSALAHRDTYSTRLCIGDDSLQLKLSSSQLAERLRLFREIGFGKIRTSVGRIGFDPMMVDDQRSRRLAYLKQAVQLGFKLKLVIESWSGTPSTFESAHPDAKIVNLRGESPGPGYISPWYPGLQALLHQENQAFFEYLRLNGLLEFVSDLIVDLGPAAEPIYPADWVLKKETPDHYSFWFYDVHAQAAFGQAMKLRFQKDISVANRRWDTSFAQWESVRIPSTGTKPGAMWSDVLTWYRESKRAVIKFQVDDCKRLVLDYYVNKPFPTLIMLLPGTHLPVDALRSAAQTGEGSYGVKLMIDSDYIIDLAAKSGCMLQQTASQDNKEILFIKSFMADRHIDVPLWAENAGGKAALDPSHLIDVMLANKLYGIDYINANSVLNQDGYNPNQIFRKLADACARVL